MRRTGAKGAVVKPAQTMGEAVEAEYREHLGDELELLSAEAKLRGLKREDFLRLCEDAFAEMGGVNYVYVCPVCGD